MLIPVALTCAWLLPPHIARFQGAWSQFFGERRSSEMKLIDLDAAIRDEGIEDALVIVHEAWHGRITARLRALGAPALTAESFLREFDACALHTGLDNEDRVGGPPDPKRVQRVALRGLMYGEAKILPGTNGSTTLAFARPIHPYCAQEMEVDQGRSVPLDWFLANARFDKNGHLAGPVVYARDFGVENQKLLARFGDRAWYRYRPRTGPNDHGEVFVRYR